MLSSDVNVFCSTIVVHVVQETLVTSIFSCIALRLTMLRPDAHRFLQDVLGLDITSTDSKYLCELLLYGTSYRNAAENRMATDVKISSME